MRALLCLALLVPACRTPAPTGPAPLVPFERSQPAMGTLFRVRGHATDAAAAERACGAAFARLYELERRLSDYDRESELSRLSNLSVSGPTGPVELSQDLFAVLDVAEQVARESGGAFDVTVGPAVRLWRRARRQAELPAEDELARARAAIGWEGVELDREARTARLARAGMRLDLGGIAKGHALDEMLRVLRAEGVERVLLDGGGDLLAGAPPPGQEGWRVVVEGWSPGETQDGRLGLLLAHEALATSGDAYRFALVDGVRYSHIVDPRTGEALTRGTSASVLAPTGARADAWASALCVLGPREGLAALRSAGPGLEARVLERSEAGTIERESVGWTTRAFRIPEDPSDTP